MAPRLMTMAGIQIIFIARDNLASRLDQVGAVTSLTYGWMIMQVPETILGTAIATAMLPAPQNSPQNVIGRIQRFNRTCPPSLDRINPAHCNGNGGGHPPARARRLRLR